MSSPPEPAENVHRTRQRLMQQYELASYFRVYRPGIPDEVVDVLLGAADRDGEAECLLDLGTGAGQMVRALHPYFRDIIAVDPAEELLGQAEQDLRPRLAPGTTLRLAHSRAEDYTPPEGWTASLVTICRAVHWMDHRVLLDHLARIVSVSGVVAIVQDNGFWRTPASWKQPLRGVIQDFLDADHVPLIPVESRNWAYDEILAESPFSDVEKIIVPFSRVRTADSVLGFLYSNAYAARSLFGDRIDEFESEVRRVLANHSDSDTFVENDEFAICLGRKP
ncbi:MAG: class I SAM-dependent methyltransferase [Actinomadura sp.]